MTPDRQHNARRRKDVYSRRAAPTRQAPRFTPGSSHLPSGLDLHGRFTGARDVERAVAHFWSAPHRRAAAPVVGDLFFEACAPSARERGRASRLTPEQLREIHAAHARGDTAYALAARYHLTAPGIRYHLRPSRAMSQALAESAPAAAARAA